MLRRLASSAALVATTALLLVGCTPPEPTETTAVPVTSEPSPDAPRETREAWERYQERMTELGMNPSQATLDDVLEIATPEFADFLFTNLSDAADRRIHTEGVRRTTAFVVADASEAPESISAHVCVDLSQERIMGDEGVEIGRPESPQSQTIEFTTATEADHYLVAGVTAYDGEAEEDPCA